MEPDIIAILVGGTLAVDFAAGVFYGPAARKFGAARVLTLPGYGTGSIEHTADKLNRKLNRDYPGSYIAACCHSQAGLVLAQCALDNPNILQAAAVATPFHGTPVAVTGWPFVRSTVDMLPRSGYLRRLGKRLPELTAADRLATVSLRHDHIVPWPSSRVDGARNYYCGTARECAAVRTRFPDTRAVVTRESKFTGHVLGLQMLQPEVERLL